YYKNKDQFGQVGWYLFLLCVVVLICVLGFMHAQEKRRADHVQCYQNRNDRARPPPTFDKIAAPIGDRPVSRERREERFQYGRRETQSNGAQQAAFGQQPTRRYFQKHLHKKEAQQPVRKPAFVREHPKAEHHEQAGCQVPRKVEDYDPALAQFQAISRGDPVSVFKAR
ncbi:MAG: hypothetical protein ACTHPD_01805, partial [Rhizomicrobium sp.]